MCGCVFVCLPGMSPRLMSEAPFFPTNRPWATLYTYESLPPSISLQRVQRLSDASVVRKIEWRWESGEGKNRTPPRFYFGGRIKTTCRVPQ